MSSKQSQKGSRFEYKVRDLLTEKTGVKWDRVPMSGAGSMKGDLYCLTNHYFYCFECKSFKDTVIQENLLNAKSNNLYSWWEQTQREAEQMNRKPALVFKKDRGKPLIMLDKEHSPKSINRFSLVSDLGAIPVSCDIMLFEEWLRVTPVGDIILI